MGCGVGSIRNPPRPFLQKNTMLGLHRHHIVPRHAAGSDDPSNFIVLTKPGHSFAHWCRWMKFGQLQDKVAWLMLAGQTEEADVAWRELMRSPAVRAKISTAGMGNKHCVGRKYSPETLVKMSTSNMGVKRSLETCARISKVKAGALRRNGKFARVEEVV